MFANGIRAPSMGTWISLTPARQTTAWLFSSMISMIAVEGGLGGPRRLRCSASPIIHRRVQRRSHIKIYVACPLEYACEPLMSAVPGSVVFFAAVLYSAFAWSEITLPDSVLWKKSLPPPSPCRLCSGTISGGGGKVVPEKKAFFSQKIFFGLYYKRKVKDRKELESCHWKVLVKPLALISVVKEDSILHYASPKCKCYCKMRCVVFSLSLFGVHEWQYSEWELAGGWGLRCNFKPHSPFIPVRKPGGRISAWNKL